jgi:GMP synthase-like glutamine amidotransferase
MRVLALIHGKDAGPGVLGEEIVASGADMEIASYALGELPKEPLGGYDAALVMGGSMNVHEVDGHPWIDQERRAIADLLDNDVPFLGICLGSQLLAAVTGGTVSRVSDPEIGWYDVETTAAAASDPVLGSLPARFTAYQWHSYCSDLPPGAVELATSPVCLQAYRLGDNAWGTQFHAEVTSQICNGWIESYDTDPDAIALGFDQEEARAAVAQNIGRWNEIGRELARGFLSYVSAGRVAA